MKVTIENMFYRSIDKQNEEEYQNIIFGVSSYVIWASRIYRDDTISFYVFKRNLSRGRLYSDVPLTVVQRFMDTSEIALLGEYARGYSITRCDRLCKFDYPEKIIEKSSLPLWFVKMIVMEKLKE